MVNRTLDEREPNRLSFVRIAAPLGFFVAVTILVLLIHNSLDSAQRTPTQASATTSAGSVAGTSTTLTKGKKRRRFYEVRNGDTLDAIAIRYDTTVDDLLRLNPKVDQYNLSPGERLRVR